LAITLNETIVSFADAAKDLPRRRRGRKIHISTFYRWCTVGCRGIVLESLQIGAKRYTSQQALQRFFERLSERARTGASTDRDPGPTIGHRTLAQRERASAAAGNRLAERGA
jgi:hypothetical protein